MDAAENPGGMQRLPAASSSRRAARGSAAVTGLALLALTVPTAATASAFEFYDVEVDATVQTAYTGDASSTDLEHHSRLSTSTRVTSRFLATIDRAADGRIIGATGEDHHTASTTGTLITDEREYAEPWDDWWLRRTECTGAGQSKNDTGRTSLWSDPLTPLVGAGLTLNLADSLIVDLRCTDPGRNGGAGPRSVQLLSPADDPFEPGPLAVTFDLPPEATTGGKVIQLFEGPAAGHAAYCPAGLDEQEHKTSCRVTFSGTISLTKVDLGGFPGEEPGDPYPPKQPPAVPPGQPSPPVPVVPANDPVKPPTGRPVPSVRRGQRAKLDAKASRTTFTVTCRGGCAGRATFRVPAVKKRGRAQLKRLTSVSFRVPKGDAARTVRITVPKAARKALLGARGAVVDLSLRDRESGRSSSARLKLAR